MPTPRISPGTRLWPPTPLISLKNRCAADRAVVQPWEIAPGNRNARSKLPTGIAVVRNPGVSMPHVTLHALESDLAGREPALFTELTEAVVSVYGEWARASVDVRLIGVPAGRWARGGQAVTSAAPSVAF